MDILTEIFNWVLEGSIRASIVIFSIMLVRWFLMRRVSATVIYSLWLPLLFAVILPAFPLLPGFSEFSSAKLTDNNEFVIGDYAGAVANHSQPSTIIDSSVVDDSIRVKEEVGASISSGVVLADGRGVGVISDALASGVNDTVIDSGSSFLWFSYLPVIWLAGAMTLFFFIHFSFVVVRRSIDSKQLCEDRSLEERVAEISAAIGLKKVPRVYISDVVSSPVVYGYWSYNVVFNRRFFTQLSDDEQGFVIKHELMHIKRGDLKMNFLQCILLSIHWFNPLIYWAFSIVRVDREVACDSDVLEGESDQKKAAYGHALLKLETKLTPSVYALPFVGRSQGREAVRHRIQSILINKQPNKIMKITYISSIVLLSLLSIVKSVDLNETGLSIDSSEPTKRGMVAQPPVDVDDKQLDFPVDKSTLIEAKDLGPEFFREYYPPEGGWMFRRKNFVGDVSFYRYVTEKSGVMAIARKVVAEHFPAIKDTRTGIFLRVGRGKGKWLILGERAFIDAEGEVERKSLAMTVDNMLRVNMVHLQSDWVKALEKKDVLDDPIVTSMWLKSLYTVVDGELVFRGNKSADPALSLPLAPGCKLLEANHYKDQGGSSLNLDQLGCSKLYVNIGDWASVNDGKSTTLRPMSTLLSLNTADYRPGFEMEEDDFKFHIKYGAAPYGRLRLVGEVLHDHFSNMANHIPVVKRLRSRMGYGAEVYQWKVGKTIVEMRAHQGNDNNGLRICTYHTGRKSGERYNKVLKKRSKRLTLDRKLLFDGWEGTIQPLLR